MKGDGWSLLSWSQHHLSLWPPRDLYKVVSGVGQEETVGLVLVGVITLIRVLSVARSGERPVDCLESPFNGK